MMPQIRALRVALLPLMLSALTLGASRVVAQSDLPSRSAQEGISIETPSPLTKREVSGRIDMRAFGGDESLVYANLGIRLGLGNGWETALRGSFADWKTLPLPGGNGIRHGGMDVELAAIYSGPHREGRGRLAGYIGLGLPNTPAQNSALLTLGFTAESTAAKRIDLILNPRAVCLSDNAIVGVGLGARVQLTESLSLVGEYTPILSGDNTRDTTTGAPRSSDIYGVALRYTAPNGRVQVDLGFTNGTGFSTGASLTPGLGGSGAFYLSLTARH